MSVINFDSTKYEEMQEFSPIPAGEYTAIIAEQEIKTTQSGNGEYISLKFQIVEGQHKGRNVFTNLNFNNPNATAVNIAMRELKTICNCFNLAPTGDFDLNLLLNKPLIIKVGVEKDNRDSNKLRNKLSMYKPYSQQTQPQQAFQPMQQAPVQQLAKDDIPY